MSEPKATFIGTVPLDFIILPPNQPEWKPYETEDLIATGVITVPKDYLLTLGSGIFFSPYHTASSLATTPAYKLPSTSQYYVVGRDVIRWGGELDPFEIDWDHYVFTPDFNKGVAIVSKAPKTELHHFSQAPKKLEYIPEKWKGIFEAIQRGEFYKEVGSQSILTNSTSKISVEPAGI